MVRAPSRLTPLSASVDHLALGFVSFYCLLQICLSLILEAYEPLACAGSPVPGAGGRPQQGTLLFHTELCFGGRAWGWLGPQRPQEAHRRGRRLVSELDRHGFQPWCHHFQPVNLQQFASPLWPRGPVLGEVHNAWDRAQEAGVAACRGPEVGSSPDFGPEGTVGGQGTVWSGGVWGLLRLPGSRPRS